MDGVDARFIILAMALIVDAFLGEPSWLWNRLSHPIVLIGRGIDRAEKLLNLSALSDFAKQMRGILVAVGLLVGGLGAGVILGWAVDIIPVSFLVEAVLVAIFLSGRSLYDHVAAVANGFAIGGLAGGREAVRHIVGRVPEALDEIGVVRAAIESLAENFSDGVVAPAFWYLVLGLPGLLAYKAINTGDSMIGYRNEKYENFGKATARLDDVVNFIPARLAALLIVLAAPLIGGNMHRAIKCMMSDAGKHRSPNAGWPEAATAGALGISLAGPRVYGDKNTNDPLVNESGRGQVDEIDISAALRLMLAAWGSMLGAILSLSALVYLF